MGSNRLSRSWPEHGGCVIHGKSRPHLIISRLWRNPRDQSLPFRFCLDRTKKSKHVSKFVKLWCNWIFKNCASYLESTLELTCEPSERATFPSRGLDPHEGKKHPHFIASARYAAGVIKTPDLNVKSCFHRNWAFSRFYFNFNLMLQFYWKFKKN